MKKRSAYEKKCEREKAPLIESSSFLMQNYAVEIEQIHTGHLLLALCAVLYLIWWMIYFWPNFNAPGMLKICGALCILSAFFTGAWAIIRIITALMAMPGILPGWSFVIFGACAYLLALFVTQHILERPVTTELILIVTWITLEFACVSALSTIDSYSIFLILAWLAVILIAAALSLLCYNAYYHLQAWPSFIDGCGPLIAMCVVSLIFALLV